MKIAVLKFGGTSVATEEGRALALGHIKRAIGGGFSVVAVVSAMGRLGAPYATDTLLSLINEGTSPLTRDLLISCGETISACVFADMLDKNGIPAVPLTGPQAGISTNGNFGEAEVTGMDTSRVKAYLNEGRAVVITGFQGITPTGETATLGRGGSDTSAVEIGGYLCAECVDIFTDVNGIAVADPHIVPNAPYLETVAYDDMRFLADCGSKVIHPRAVAAAKKHGVTVRVRSTFGEEEGTTLNGVNTQGLVGCALLKGQSREEAALVGVKLPKSDSFAIITAVYRPLERARELIKEIAYPAVFDDERQALRMVVADDAAESALSRLFSLLAR